MSNPNRLVALFIGLSMALLACTTDGGGASTPSAAASVEPSAPPAAATIAVADSSLGQIVVDDAGVTLYGFTPDEGGTPTCYDQCAENWPPLLADDPAAVTVGAGLDQSLLTSVDRTDGSTQLVYGGWPLYYFAADAAAGDTNGQGVGEKWFVVASSGDLIQQ
jgi:predicted lipoprotein with Yx(FWY)xxD motif